MNDFLQLITFQKWFRKQKLKTFSLVQFLWRPPIYLTHLRIPPSVNS